MIFSIDEIYILKSICVVAKYFPKAAIYRDIERNLSGNEIGKTKVSENILKDVKSVILNYSKIENSGANCIIDLILYHKENFCENYFLFLKEIRSIYEEDFKDLTTKPLYKSEIIFYLRSEKLNDILNEEI